MKNFILLLILFACFLTANAQELNVPAGKQFSYITHLKGNGSNKYDEEHTYLFKSLGKDADGNQVFECKLIKAVERNTYDHSKKDLNTDDLLSTNFNSSGVLNDLALIQRPFKLVFSPTGKLLRLEGYEKIMEGIDRDWILQDGIRKQLLSSKDHLTSNLQQLFIQYPEQPGGVNGEWKARSGVSYKIVPSSQLPQNLSKPNSEMMGMLQEKSKKVKQQDFVGVNYVAIGFVKEKGQHLVDPKTGLIHSSIGTKAFKTEYGSMTYITNDDFSQKLRVDLKEIPHDTAWINMAVRLSSWSEFFKTGNDWNEKKMFNYFKSKDSTHSKDPFYNNKKLHVIQKWAREKKRDSLYDQALVSIPNRDLLQATDNLHLSNKVNTLSRIDPVAAYDAARYAYKSEVFDDFLHHFSIAQQFLSPYLKYKSEGDRYLILLKLMAEDKNPVLRAKSLPLYTWANASIQPENSKILLSASQTLLTANVEDMKLGNGARYSLMVYSMLLKSGLKQEANKLLEATIAKLKLSSTDSLYKKRVEDKNILAHAYYLKHLAAKEAGDTKAIQYLSLAAQNSPSNPKEKTINMYYDKHFLKSKESYREDFLTQLFSLGNKAEIIKTFAAHISAEPESLLEMQQLYTRHFPQDNFTAVLFSEVIDKWHNAPDFKLKDYLDKQFFTMKEYAGKWMVIDFWGTWCGPCIVELPAINAFNEELSKNKYPNATFLSIACKDFHPTVQAFMTKNNYDFPVLMSDGNIQKKYKVDGYPYKVLVSPNGKMITLQRGKNWQNILKSFSGMTPVN